MNDLGQAAVSADKAPRTERGRRTVRKLLEAAAQEFGERGYHEAAITGITSRAGVALGTFYTYFESKEELFRALVRDMSRATRQHVAEAVRGAPDRLAAEGGGPSPFIGVRRRGLLSRALPLVRRRLSRGPCDGRCARRNQARTGRAQGVGVDRDERVP